MNRFMFLLKAPHLFGNKDHPMKEECALWVSEDDKVISESTGLWLKDRRLGRGFNKPCDNQKSTCPNWIYETSILEWCFDPSLYKESRLIF